MAGINPYIEKVKFTLPTRPFAVTFHVEESQETKTFTVDPGAIPYGRTGLPGSILDLAEGAGIEIDHSCGGVCACATCHLHVTEGFAVQQSHGR
jgi:ferredoxin, 2Fe-2S